MRFSGFQQVINGLNLSKQQLESINTRIATKDKEMQDKKSLYGEYDVLLKKFIAEVEDKTKELELVRDELKLSSVEEADALKLQIDQEKDKASKVTDKINSLNKEIFHFNSNKAVLEHSYEQKKKDSP